LILYPFKYLHFLFIKKSFLICCFSFFIDIARAIENNRKKYGTSFWARGLKYSLSANMQLYHTVITFFRVTRDILQSVEFFARISITLSILYMYISFPPFIHNTYINTYITQWGVSFPKFVGDYTRVYCLMRLLSSWSTYSLSIHMLLFTYCTLNVEKKCRTNHAK